MHWTFKLETVFRESAYVSGRAGSIGSVYQRQMIYYQRGQIERLGLAPDEDW